MKPLILPILVFMKTMVCSIGLLGLCPNLSAQIVTYPICPGQTTSSDFTMTVNGSNVPVQKLGPDPVTDELSRAQRATILGKETDPVNMANFSCKGELTVVVTARERIDTFLIRPKSKAVKGKADGDKLTFTMPGPGKLQVEVNKLAPLAVFANPLEVNTPKQEDPKLVYYGPGAHTPGQINLESHQTIYIAGGSVVTANVRGSHLQNVKIMGRGILRGNVKISGTTHLLVDGIIVNSTGRGWINTLTDCHRSAYRNVKVFGYSVPWSTDGINPVGCTHFSIDDCYLRTGDDCIAVKCRDYGMRVDSITVTNCIMAGWLCNDGFTIGFELNGSPVENILVKNCDILRSRKTRGPTGGHACFSIVCDGPAMVRNIRFEDIRCEEDIEYNNFDLIVTHGSYYGDDPPGHINGVYLKNISWEKADAPFRILGLSPDNGVENVTFDNCTVGGKPLRSADDAKFEINSYAKNVKFIYEDQSK
jgi:hypothetical protein